MRIKFVKNWAGRAKGEIEDNPDMVLCRRWIALGVAKSAEKGEPTSKSDEGAAPKRGRAMDRAVGPPPRGRK